MYLLNNVYQVFNHQHRMFNLDAEQTISAWFTSILLFLIGFIFIINIFKQPPPYQKSIIFLIFMGTSFIFLSMDEAVSFHEFITYSLVKVNWLPRFKNNHGIWIPIYGGLMILMICLLRKYIQECWMRHRKEAFLFSLGFSLILVGGVLLEIISYQYLRADAYKNVYLIEVAFEEGFEMLGACIMLYATLLFTLK